MLNWFLNGIIYTEAVGYYVTILKNTQGMFYQFQGKFQWVFLKTFFYNCVKSKNLISRFVITTFKKPSTVSAKNDFLSLKGAKSRAELEWFRRALFLNLYKMITTWLNCCEASLSAANSKTSQFEETTPFSSIRFCRWGCKIKYWSSSNIELYSHCEIIYRFSGPIWPSFCR